MKSLFPTFSAGYCGEVLDPRCSWIWGGEDSVPPISSVLWLSKSICSRGALNSPLRCVTAVILEVRLLTFPLWHLILQIHSCVWNWFLLLLPLSTSYFQEIKCEKEGVRIMKTNMSHNFTKENLDEFCRYNYVAHGFNALLGLSN